MNHLVCAARAGPQAATSSLLATNESEALELSRGAELPARVQGEGGNWSEREANLLLSAALLQAHFGDNFSLSLLASHSMRSLSRKDQVFAQAPLAND